MKLIHFTLLFILSCMSLRANMVFAQSVSAEHAQMIRTNLVRDITEIVREFDAAALVFVRTTMRKQDFKLPGTPFLLKDAAINSNGAEAPFAQIRVEVVTSSGSLPDSAQVLIRKLASEFTTLVNVEVKSLSADYLNARAKAQQDVATKSTQLKIWEKHLGEILASARGLRSIGASANTGITRAKLGMGLLVGLCLFLLLPLFVFLRSQRQMLNAINQGFKQLSVSFETSGGGSALRIQDVPQQRLAANPQLALGAGDSWGNLGLMPEDGLLSLLCDCYWTNSDSYGSYIWRRIPIDKKMSLIRKFPELSTYGAYVGQIAEENLGMDQDPSYLSPLPIWNVDAIALTEIVRQHPQILRLLSPLRVASLILKPAERLELAKRTSAQDNVQVIPNFEQVKCQSRVLRKSYGIVIKSEQDEMEILSVDSPSLDLIEEVPSLGWLLKLQDEEVTRILQTVSARELASAWVGPQDVLDRLGQYIGSKKMELMKSHLDRVKPDRSSAAFLAIHHLAVSALKASVNVDESSNNYLETMKNAS